MIAVPFILNTLASFVVGLLVAKFLGPAEYGRYAIAMAIGIVWQTIGFDWLRLSATRFTASDSRDAGVTTAATLQALFLALGALTLIAALALYVAPTALPLPPALIALAALVALANGAFDDSGAVLRAHFLDRSYRTLVLARTLLSLVLILGGAYVFASAEMALAGLVVSLVGAAALANGAVVDRAAPVVTAVTPWRCPTPPTPRTVSGVGDDAEYDPLPSSPDHWAPQHWTVPSSMRAQLCRSPVATATAGPDRPDTVVASRKAPPPGPSSSYALLPQHCTAPEVRTAQEWLSPAAIATTPLSPETPTGTSEDVVDPLPSSP